MIKTRIVRGSWVGLILIVAVALVGCKSSQATPAAGQVGLNYAYTSQTLTTAYPGALNAASQLMLGTIRLEGTKEAVTPEQAKTLLVLWQALSGQVLQSDAEREAVLAKIEELMTPAQRAAIAAMQLTQDDLLAQTPGGGVAPGPGGAEQPAGSGTPSAPGGAFSGGGQMPAEMATRQAQFASMSDEERAAWRATAQASGAFRGGSARANTGSGQGTVGLAMLIRLLSQRAAEGAAPTPASPIPTPAPMPLSTPSPEKPYKAN